MKWSVAQISWLCAVGVMAGCARDQFVLEKDSAGRTVRLNKATGEVTVIAGDRLIVPKSDEEMKADEEAKSEAASKESAKLANRKDWGVVQILGTKFNTSTIYMNGSLKYSVATGKIPRGFYSGGTREIHIVFLRQGIKVFVDTAEVIRSTDRDGNVVALHLTGDINMSVEDYKLLDSVSFEWYGF